MCPLWPVMTHMPHHVVARQSCHNTPAQSYNHHWLSLCRLGGGASSAHVCMWQPSACLACGRMAEPPWSARCVATPAGAPGRPTCPAHALAAWGCVWGGTAATSSLLVSQHSRTEPAIAVHASQSLASNDTGEPCESPSHRPILFCCFRPLVSIWRPSSC